MSIFSFKSSHRRCSVKKGVLKKVANFTGKHLCRGLFLIKLQAFRFATLLKETPTLVFYCEICEIFKNTYFEEFLPTTAYVVPSSWLSLSPFFSVQAQTEMAKEWGSESLPFRLYFSQNNDFLH